MTEAAAQYAAAKEATAADPAKQIKGSHVDKHGFLIIQHKSHK